ncbi:MAG TPA: glycosyltransferase [Candidatus Paceibacterota bacterium]|jgi:glycosyltransferase involved in cell wall biosynthesis|nr:glycosyltransferase [Candidatus Paceibacterota bacterium]
MTTIPGTDTIKPKKILIFSFVYYPRFIGGAEIAIKEITDRISSQDIEFDLVALRIDKKLPRFERIGNVNVYRIGFVGNQRASADSLPWYLHLNKYLYPFLSAYVAHGLNRKKHYDAVWAMMANYSGFGALFFKLFNMSTPFILTLQEGDPFEYIEKRVRFVRPLFKMIFKKADCIQAISRYLASFASSQGATCPVVVVPNGVDTSHFRQSFDEGELENVRVSLGKEPHDIFIITTSRLVVKNAVGDIVASLVHLPPYVKLLVLGTGYEEASLKKQAQDLGVMSRVHFLGYVSHKEMPKYLKISDVFVRPSLSEGFGNSFIEAMAAGIPVIATPVGGIVDFLVNKETGLLCDVHDPKDIARKVEMYMRDVLLRNEIVENAMHMVLDRYDWSVVVEQMREGVFDKSFGEK